MVGRAEGRRDAMAAEHECTSRAFTGSVSERVTIATSCYGRAEAGKVSLLCSRRVASIKGAPRLRRSNRFRLGCVPGSCCVNSVRRAGIVSCQKQASNDVAAILGAELGYLSQPLLLDANSVKRRG